MSMPERGSTEERRERMMTAEERHDEQERLNNYLDKRVVRQMHFDIREQGASPSRRLPQAVLDLIASGDRGVDTLLFDMFYWIIVEDAVQWESWRSVINILKEAAANEREGYQ